MILDGAESGQFPAAADQVENWVAEQMSRHENPGGAYELKLADGRWLKASDRRTNNGCVVCLRTDITEFKRREKALRTAEETSRKAREAAERANFEQERVPRQHQS